MLDTVIASPKRCYDATEEAVRDKESDWGDLLTDNMRKAHKSIYADVAVLNGGTIRIDDTICEDITFEDLERTFAYPTTIVLVKLKGKDLKEQILDNAAGSKRGDGRFLQISGVSFRRERKPDGSSIIKDLQVESAKGRVAFDENKTYVVAVNKYLFDCGDRYRFREYVTDYIPAGPDLRALTYATLVVQSKSKPQGLGRIIDLPFYVKPVASPSPKWQALSEVDRGCS